MVQSRRGINAGVMLWQPNLRVFREMLAELREPKHPEHCFANGPEQERSKDNMS